MTGGSNAKARQANPTRSLRHPIHLPQAARRASHPTRPSPAGRCTASMPCPSAATRAPRAHVGLPMSWSLICFWSIRATASAAPPRGQHSSGTCARARLERAQRAAALRLGRPATDRRARCAAHPSECAGRQLRSRMHACERTQPPRSERTTPAVAITPISAATWRNAAPPALATRSQRGCIIAAAPRHVSAREGNATSAPGLATSAPGLSESRCTVVARLLCVATHGVTDGVLDDRIGAVRVVELREDAVLPCTPPQQGWRATVAVCVRAQGSACVSVCA